MRTISSSVHWAVVSPFKVMDLAGTSDCAWTTTPYQLVALVHLFHSSQTMRKCQRREEKKSQEKRDQQWRSWEWFCLMFACADMVAMNDMRQLESKKDLTEMAEHHSCLQHIHSAVSLHIQVSNTWQECFDPVTGPVRPCFSKKIN